ncbi:MAG: hypothetical protein PHT34_05385 [Oscillospiraceae bacterium]|nr:hypothetical protein [Oscillospiraceae bacterium]
MLRITRVDTLDDQTLDIELSNGHLILFNMTALLNNDPAFTTLRQRIPLPCPKTDGDHIRWRGGPQIGLDEILGMIGREDAEAESGRQEQ